MLLFILCYHHDFYNRMLSSWLIHQIAISMVSTTQRYRHDFHNRTLIPWFHQQNAVMVDKTECYHCDWHNRMLSPQLTQQIAISVSPWLTQQNDITMIDRTLSPSLTQQNAISRKVCCESELLGVQQCWFAQYQWRANKAALSHNDWLAVVLTLFITSQTHTDTTWQRLWPWHHHFQTQVKNNNKKRDPESNWKRAVVRP